MRHYGIMVILGPETDERTANAALKKLLQTVPSNGGTVDKIDIWGKRRLAYDTKKKSEGFCAVVDVTTTPGIAQGLDHQLGLNKIVLRTKPPHLKARASTRNGNNAMTGDTIITIIGNLTANPEVRFTPSGAVVTSFTAVSTSRTFDRQAGGWEDEETLFVRCSIWRNAVEDVTGSLTKGTHVIVQDRLIQRSYTTREDENRAVVEIQIDEIGPSLRYAKVQITRQPRGGGQGGFGGDQGGPRGGGFGGNQGGQGGYSQGDPQQGGYSGGGGFGGQGQSGYSTPADGAADDLRATGGSTSSGDKPPF